VGGHTDKVVPTNRINDSAAEAETHTSKAESGNSATKGTEAMAPTMKTWARLTLR